MNATNNRGSEKYINIPNALHVLRARIGTPPSILLEQIYHVLESLSDSWRRGRKLRSCDLK